MYDIKYFSCFKDYIIINPVIDNKYNWNIYDNKLIPDINEQCAEIINLIHRNRMNYGNVLVKIDDKKQRKLLINCLKIDIRLLYM